MTEWRNGGISRRWVGAAAVLVAVVSARAAESRAGLIASDQPFAVNEVTAGEQAVPRAAIDSSGRTMVVWDSASDGDDWGIFGRLYDAGGAPLGGEFPVNTNTTGAQLEPVVGASSSGGFVVVWASIDPISGGADMSTRAPFLRRRQPAGWRVSGRHVYLRSPRAA